MAEGKAHAAAKREDSFELLLIDRIDRLERTLEMVARLVCPTCKDAALAEIHPEPEPVSDNGQVPSPVGD